MDLLDALIITAIGLFGYAAWWLVAMEGAR